MLPSIDPQTCFLDQQGFPLHVGAVDVFFKSRSRRCRAAVQRLADFGRLGVISRTPTPAWMAVRDCEPGRPSASTAVDEPHERRRGGSRGGRGALGQRSDSLCRLVLGPNGLAPFRTRAPAMPTRCRCPPDRRVRLPVPASAAQGSAFWSHGSYRVIGAGQARGAHNASWLAPESRPMLLRRRESDAAVYSCSSGC